MSVTSESESLIPIMATAEALADVRKFTTGIALFLKFRYRTSEVSETAR
jgi:hypothetical protein